MSKPKTFKLFYFTVDNGDGSASPRFFRTKKGRDALAQEEEENGQAFCDADGELEFFFNEAGEIIGADTIGELAKFDWFKSQIGD